MTWSAENLQKLDNGLTKTVPLQPRRAEHGRNIVEQQNSMAPTH